MIVFFGPENEINVSLDLSSVAEGETGSDLPARFLIDEADVGFEASMCRVEITENLYLRTEPIGDERRLEGSGTCSDPATAVSGAADTVTIGPFSFVATAGYGS